MKKLIILFSIFLFSSVFANTTFISKDQQILGAIEQVILLDKNLVLDAKLDTGAGMSSLSATEIKIFKQQKKTWVQFTVIQPKTKEKIIFTKPLLRYIKILKRQEENQNLNSKEKCSKRPVVALTIKIGNKSGIILVNLVDRSQFQYPLLIGSDALRSFNILIDVNKNAHDKL